MTHTDEDMQLYIFCICIFLPWVLALRDLGSIRFLSTSGCIYNYEPSLWADWSDKTKKAMWENAGTITVAHFKKESTNDTETNG